MFITYKFVDGSQSIVELDDYWGNIILEIEDETARVDRKETRRHRQLSTMTYEGAAFADGTDVLNELIDRQTLRQLREAMSTLRDDQRELIHKRYFSKRTLVDIAAEENVSEAAIRGRLKRIYEQLKKSLD